MIGDKCYGDEWLDHVEGLKKELFSIYFEPEGYEKFYIEKFELIIPSFNRLKDRIIYNKIDISCMVSYFETGIYDDHNGESFKGFRIFNNVFLFKIDDWNNLKNDFDLIPCYVYYINNNVKYSECRFKYLASVDILPHIARKKKDMIEIYKQYINCEKHYNQADPNTT